MASPTNGYSREPMSRMQYLMLLAVEHGASLDDAADCALAWGAQHPQSGLFDYRPYAGWRRSMRPDSVDLRLAHA